ncbi:MAG: hypothetical protein ONB48_01995 [candidate division KSB1 bacterium]|nr:hypothetical protein [candidate division KSB1 bacterium]MDZ7272549.1 hypothetical protein [candidate division KSB1 bacterium]MDZ7284428.1 hypothetical protein [candidate division KSB1 bacterium]MDZ7297176.1 hypothetical protein [candidate division KSB1 bacterium]MDZ7306685.1 hypothetical protein [candidate division KSB1 bacterium]
MLAQRDVARQPQIKSLRQTTLPNIVAGSITAMATGWGYLTFAAANWGIGLMANAFLNPPRLMSRFRNQPGDLVTRFQPVSHPQWLPGFLALGRRVIFHLTLAPHPGCRCLFRLSDKAWQIHEAVISGTRVVIRLYNRLAACWRWLSIDTSSRQVVTLPWQHFGPASRVIKLSADNEILYHTVQEAVRLNLDTGQESHSLAPGTGFDVSAPPLRHPHTGQIFLLGCDDVIYCLDPANINRGVIPFATGLREASHLLWNTAGDTLLALGHGELTAFDARNGIVLWRLGCDAARDFAVNFASPQRWGDHLIVVVRSPGGADERLGLLGLSPAGQLLPLSERAALSPAPVGSASGLIAVLRPEAVSQQSAAFLQFNFF